MLRLRPVLFLTTLAGCFGTSPPAADAPAHAPLALTVTDSHGARYGSAAVPRDPIVRLVFAGTPPAMPAARLWRGEIHDGLAAVLHARGADRLTDLEVPMVVTHEPTALALTPSVTLAPGARYTVVWGDAEALLTFPLAVSPSAALGAAAVETLPADQARGVPRNLDRALVRFDGALAADDAQLAAHLVLRDPHGAEVPSRLASTPCELLGLPPGICAARTPNGPLTPGPHHLELSAGLATLTGAPVPAMRATFEVGAEDDLSPPALEPATCDGDEVAVSGVCVRVDARAVHLRGRGNEPVEVVLLSGHFRSAGCAALAGDGAFTLSCAGEPVAALTLRLRDLAGQGLDLPLVLPRAAPRAAVSIDELRADPRGKEPAQEYVELLSSAPDPVSLMGFTLSTDRDRARTVAGSVTLMPGERALVVGPAFDPADTRDGTLPPSLKLVRLDRALGLANAGARVVLRDASGKRLSVGHALAPLVEGQCSARRGDDPDADARDGFALDPNGSCTPGRATFARGR